MKKPVSYLFALMAVFFVACSSDDDRNDTKIVVNPNVSDSKLDQKSGGVYFVSTLAGEYIFRLNLKNGDDAMTCEMFHNEDYSELAPAETAWEPGEVLDNLQFSSGEVKLILSLNEEGEGEAQVFVGEDEFEAVIFKSTAKEPVKVYSGWQTEVLRPGEASETINSKRQTLILKNRDYYFGMIEDGGFEYYILGIVNELTDATVSFMMPNCVGWSNDCEYNSLRTLPYTEEGIYISLEELDKGYESNIFTIDLPLLFIID